MSALPHEIYHQSNEVADFDGEHHPQVDLRALEAADYISVLLLQMRMIAKYSHLDNLQILLEDAYYCAFATAHPLKVVPEDESDLEGD